MFCLFSLLKFFLKPFFDTHNSVAHRNNKYLNMNMRNFYSLLFLLVSSFISTLNAQIIIKNGSVSTNTCGAVFYDSGGANGNYKANETYTFTIYSNDPTHNHISLGFDLLDIADGDDLCFFDGTSTSAPLLACASDLSATQNAIIQSTATNASGCITVRFRSDGSTQGKGWSANIICIPSCQTIKAVVDATIPTIMPADTGWIDACPNTTRVNFKAHGVYPQNGYAYGQSDTINKFEWNFNDGSPVAYGTDVTHIFEKAGGYVVRLTITDTMGCQNINYIKQRVRVSPRPTFKLGSIPSQVCAGTEIKLKAKTGSIDTSYQVSTTQNQESFQFGAVRSERLFIPDDPSKEYRTSIYFTDFGPGQTLTNINDFLDVFVNMEHSWARDLEIKLVCPNRQSVILHKYDVSTRNKNELHIGIPNENDAVLSQFVNDSTMNPPGKGLRYEWTPTATQTWRSFTTPSPLKLAAGKYKSDASLNGLLGCPLNGEWSLVVKDQFQYDNGWIFAWGIDFSKNLYPKIETFTPQVVEHGWVKNDYITTAYSTDLMTIRPKNAGTASVIYRVKDNFNCTFDTTLNINVLPPTNALCMACALDTLFTPMADTTICSNQGGIRLNVSPKDSVSKSIPFDAFPNQEIDATTAPLASPYISTLAISDIAPSTVTDPLSQIDSVCVDLSTFIPGDMVLDLRSPSGQTIRLFDQRGGIGFSLNNLCFSPKATRDIATALPPYSGTYQPEGGVATWNTLIGSTLNGNWDLLVSDVRGVNKDTLKRWSITFKNKNGLKYTWAPTTGLSCTDCPNPRATPSVSTTYTVTVRDSFNCTYTDNIAVTVIDSLAAPKLSVENINFTFIIFGWEAVAGASGYEVSVNNGAWFSPNGALSHAVTNLKIGDSVNLRVRAVSSSTCGVRISSITESTKPCVATIGNGFNRRLEIDSILCQTLASPRVNFAFANGISPFTFIIDTINNGSNPLFFDLIGAGTHTAILIDSTGCSDTLTFNLTEPSPIGLNLTATGIKCFGDDNGKITAIPSGGVGNYNYRLNSFILGDWRDTPVFDTLTAGTYTLELRDSNGCSISRDTEIVSPSLLLLDVTKQDIRCFGDSSGIALGIATGGTLPYNWQWSNGGTTSQIDSLQVGIYDVTLTDKNGCSTSGSVDIEQNTEIRFVIAVDSVKCFGEETGRIQVNTTGGLSPYTYYWSNNYFGEVNDGVKAGTYQVTATDALGCIVTTSATVYQPDSLRFDSLVTVNTKCPNEATGSARAYVNGGIMPYEFTWSPSLKTGQSIVDMPIGEYISTVKDANGCVLDKEFTIKSNAEINVDRFVIVTPLKCAGDSNGEIRVQASGGTGNFNYNWNTSPTQSSALATNLAAGTYTVTITDSNNCTFIADTVLTEPERLQATIASFNDVKCKGETNGTATPSVIGGTPFAVGIKYNYQWSDNQTTPVATGLAVGTYSLTVTDANGCRDTTLISISEPLTAVSAVAVQTKLGCYNQNTGEAAVEASGGVGSYTYLWNNLQRTQAVANLADQQYRVTVTDGNGCQASDTVDVVTYDSIKVSVSIVDPRCYSFKNGSLTIDSISGGATNRSLNNLTFRWNTSPIQTSSQAVNLEGNRTYTLTVVDNQGCQNTASYFVKEPQRIYLTSLNKNISCFGGSDGEIEIQPNGQKPPFSYQWDQNASGQISARATSLVAGKFTVRVTDSTNCSVDTTITLTQPPVLKVQNVQITGTKCTNESTGKIDLSVTGGVPSYTYQWSNGANTTAVQNLRAGSYDFTVIDANNCRLTQTFAVTSPETLDGEVSVQNVQCFGEANGKITIDAFGGTQPYLFSIDGKTYNGINQVVGIKAGKYDVFVKDANNCIWFETAQVTQPSRFTIEAMPDVTINLGDSVQLYANAQNNRGNVDFWWKAPYDSTLSCVKCLTPTAKPIYTITYAIHATDSAGCRATDSVKVSVVKPRYVLVPTGFTPNSDQVNDALIVRGKEGTKILVYRIYDRWGELVHEAKDFYINDEKMGWDGSFRGQPMTSGIYVWYIEAQYIDGAKEILKGHTTLIR